jgi:hypothetical protein
MTKQPAIVICEGKQAFATRELAMRVLKAQNRRHDATMSAYKCRCGSYHIGHTNKLGRK